MGFQKVLIRFRPSPTLKNINTAIYNVQKEALHFFKLNMYLHI